jgi:3-dehydroquinate dehydratase/shikimate dehydrogenase
MPKTHDQLKEWLPKCSEADLVEIRLDYLPKLDFKSVRGLTDKPLIATLRSRREGGFWEGKPAENLKIMQNAINAGVDYLDIELPFVNDILPKLKRGDAQIVLSHHKQTATAEQLKSILQQMATIEANIYKLVFKVDLLHDNLYALKLAEYAQSLGLNYIIHAMGKAGQPSRLLGALKGNAWTYVSGEFAEETAPGQLALHEAKNYYFLPNKSAETKILGLVGSPIQQSKGWRLHNKLISQKFHESSGNGNDFLYLNFQAEHLDEFWLDWSDYIHGLSVTIPYKEQIVKYLNQASTEVKISGVCNTLVREGSVCKGYNTDLTAIETLLRPYEEQSKNGGLIIGTGATARSAIAALKRLEVDPIAVVGRNEERGKMLSEIFGVDYLAEDEVHYASAAIIIQTTPLGMVPYIDKYPVGTALFRRDRVVLDVIYNPEETRYLRIAKERGCITISGVEMFLLQAAKQFEIFTGSTVSPEEVRSIWNELR